MATIKSFSDLQQSKKLAEILPLESADGFWEYHDKWYSEGDEWEGYEDYPRAEPYLEYPRKENEWKEEKQDIPCWSLAALINIIKPINENTYTIRGTLDGGAIISFDEVTNVMFQEEEIIDAVFEMVVWLKEINKL